LDQILEAQGVDGFPGQAELIATSAGDDLRLGLAVSQCLAQSGDVELEVLGGAWRGVLAPEAIDQLITAQRRVCMQREHGDDAALLASPERECSAVDERLDGPEKAHFQAHGEPVRANVPAGS
jgi:hypothetical protein